MERLFDLDAQLLGDSVLMLIAVLVLYFLLSYLFFNPIRNLLDARKKMIADQIAEAKKDREDAAALKSEYDEKLKNADKETDEILSQARQKALQNEQRIESQAKTEASRIIARAEEEAILEKKRALDDVKQEMISVAAMMATKVVQQNINTEIEESLVDATLKEMGDKTWQS
ncbi:MAG: F0F1 ATP synthase subunit B [Lachnospiraceae bacterium]|nr:F0F1 ATP synthase subunit B [Lachnospiraceae bacterium]MBQ9342346.1 F0F1 ATP synthase subunit B [Lachnospiraceae bacterium]MBQ9579947.1 F0F1 ATP synthase subunit B [Lachnospiraceae bacterium]MCR5344737.1 F0F1 ATP synthase subunit B [Lachnospiraceae bacterium]